jgi:lysophospholipase L1-like esterase
VSAKTRRFLQLSLLFGLGTVSLLVLGERQQSRAAELGAERLRGGVSDYSAEASALRGAGYCRAGVVLAGAFYALALGVLFAPPALRLISGNVALFLALVVVLDVSTSFFGPSAPRIGRPGIAGDFGLWVYDETKGWFHAPSSKAESFFGGPDRGSVRINQLGLRGAEVEPKRPGLFRVLVFGDSYVFGVGVDEENVVTTELQRLLEPLLPSGVEVVNLGVSGYSTDQEYILWKELGRSLEPDLLILVVCDNDYEGNTESFAWRRYYKPYFEVDDAWNLTLRNVPVPELSRTQRAKLWLGQESNLWSFAASRKSERPAVQAFLDSLQVDVSRAPRNPHRTMRAILKAWAGEARAAGSGFLVTSTGRRAEDPSLFLALAEFLEREGIDHLDMFPILHQARIHEPDRLWDFPNDTHWNRDAHALVARSLFDVVRERYLAPTLPPSSR